MKEYNKNIKNKYVIELTEQQLTTIATGLEFYSRFLSGQWEIPDSMQWQEYENTNKDSGFWDIRNSVEDSLGRLKSEFTGLDFNASYGIGSSHASEDSRIAYDIYRPIWETLYKDNGTWNVYSRPGLSYSKEGRINVIKKGS